MTSLIIQLTFLCRKKKALSLGKKGKGQLDKGTTRGPRKKKGLYDDKEEEQLAPGPSKHQKVSAKPSKGKKLKSAKSQPPPSKEFIDSEDDKEPDDSE